MPKIPYTLRRGQTYYLRQRIPTDLLPVYGGKTDIIRSLKTTNPAEAKSRLRIALLHIQSEFDQKRKTMQKPGLRRSLTDLSETEIASMVVRWHQEQSKAAEESFSNSPLSENKREEIIETLREEEGEARQNLIYGQFYLDHARSLLADKKIQFDEQSEYFTKFQTLLARASLDLITRSLQQYQGDTVLGSGDPIFSRPLNTMGEETITFDQLCKLYEKNKIDKGLKPRSIKAMQDEIDFLKNFILEDADIKQITRTKCRDIFDTIKQVPANASKIYPGKTIQQAIELGAKNGSRLLSIRTINGHISRLSSLFKFAQNEMLMDGNPANNLLMTDPEQAKNKRTSLTIDDLNKIFSAPLYTGCVDDENNYNKVGKKIIRRSRFWLPLIALYTGMRMEEICQLQTSDIQFNKGIYVIEVRRVIKTKNSRRIIPVHPELIKMGFIDYVDDMRKKKNDRIFPELKLGSNGIYSHHVSKWFGRFLDNLEINDPKLCFHSFRHTFRDGLTEARIPLQFVRALCGWSSNSMDDLYGTGVPAHILYEQIEFVDYLGLDLTHLYIKKPQPR